MASGFVFKGNTMEIDFMSKGEASKIMPDKNMALISITDIEDKDIHIPFHKWENVTKLNFHDIDEKQEGMTLFNVQMARQIIKFVLGLPDNVNRIVVHCYAGISRSAAIVRFLQKFVYEGCFNPQFWISYNMYNRKVFSALSQVWVDEFLYNLEAIKVVNKHKE